jgi:hypothetical protein
MAEIRINTTGGLKLYDADNSHYAQIVAGTITSNVDAITLGHDTVTIADNLSLGSDSAILKFGADTEIALTHVADTGLKLTDSGGTPTLQLHDANESIASDGSKVIITSGGTAFSLPTSDGSNGQALVTNGSAVLSFATVAAADPSSADGDSLGTASAEWSDLYLADGGIVYFGNDQDIRLTHNADKGLILKHTATADDKPVILTLQTGETDMAANDVIGKIEFQAPDEGTGTDAVLVSAAIQAVAEGDHSSSSNATRIEFMVGASEAAAKKMLLTSAGKLEVDGGIDIEGGAVFNEDSADVDFRVESNGNTHALFVDAGNDRIGVLNSSPAVTLDVTGTIRASTGILFGTDTSADNTLDDYEEGSSDLSFQDSAGANYSGSYGSVRNFRYQKIGNRVYGQFRVQTNSGGNISSGLTSSNAIQLSGLPFTSNSASAAHYGIGHAASDSFGVNFDGDDRDVFCYVEPGSSIIKFAFTHDNDEPERVLVSEIPVFSPGAYAGYMLAGNLTYLV